MTAPLLTTKLYIPSTRPELVSRPHLIERLDAALPRRLTLISAPAGFGKTTLLSEWIAGRGRPFAWVSLDRGDNDPARFWAYFVAALQTIPSLSQASVGKAALAALESPRSPPLESVLASLINDIAAAPAPFTLVLDDYHLIEAQPIHDALAFLLDHMPPQMHLVIASRADPPLPLSRLRGRSHLTELRTADLRFTPDEASAFLSDVMGLGLSAEDVATLDARTEGWIVGLQMVALSMQGRDAERVAGFIAAFAGSHRYILDYLTDEVLLQQPETVQAFLLQTAILDRLTGSLCDAVTGRSDSREMLDRLDTLNLFVVALDDERQWYRYHHLFADLLRRRQGSMQPDLLSALHRRASEWYEKSGLIAEAVSHAFAAGDLDRVEQLIAERALTMIYHGELTTLMGWLEALPHEVVVSRPWLCVAYAWVLGFAGQPGSTQPVLQAAENALEDVDQPVERQRISGHIAAIRAYVSMQEREVSRAVALTREALENLPEEDLMVRSFTTAVAGVVLRMSGDLVAAAQATTEAIALAQAAGAHFIANDARCDLVKLHRARGQLRRAAATCQDALRLAGGPAEQGGWPSPIMGQVSAWLSLVLCEWNDLEAALHYARDGLELCRRWGQTSYLGLAYSAMGKTFQAMGDADGALDAIQQAQQVVNGLPSAIIALVTAWEMQIRLAQGDTATAWRWAQASGLSVDDELMFHRYEQYHTLAQVIIAQGEPDAASALLARLLKMAEAAGAMGCVIEVLVLQAIALQAKGQADQGLITLKNALALAEPEGYMRTFIDQGAPMAALLRTAVSHGIATTSGVAYDYVGRLLAAFEEAAPPLHPHPYPPLIEPLTERELAVLRLLATGLSNREIAEEIYLSINTVKTHTRSIYGKLNVRSRTQAANRARELGLL